jgi:hypothetical membrane protein
MSAIRSVSLNDRTTKLLLACGVLAGPVFTLAWLAAGATRPNYDPLRHPISSLAIGAEGWTQTASFIVNGLLTLAFAFGLARALRLQRGSRWGTWLIGLVAIGLLGAGVFVTDPMNGYPPGTTNLPTDYSVAGRLHRLFSAGVFLGLPAACFVFARLFGRWGERRWQRYSLSTGIAFIILFILTSMGFGQLGILTAYAGLLQRITLTVGWIWLTLLGVHFRKGTAKACAQ